MEAKTVSASRVTLTQLMGPDLANIQGNIHGGVLMKLCDEAGAMATYRHAMKPTVTVAVDSMSFRSAVQIGDLVTVQAEVAWVGRSSMEARVVVTAENILKGEVTHTNTAYFVYVALDGGKPSPAPPLICETDEERVHHENAAERQRFRLIQRERGLL